MTRWQRERARNLARRSIKQALSREGLSPRNPLEAVAQSALTAQKGGKLALWLEVAVAVAQELSEAAALTHSLIARARQQASEKKSESLLCAKVRESVYGGSEPEQDGIHTVGVQSKEGRNPLRSNHKISCR